MVYNENEPILDSDERREEKNFIMDKCSCKIPNLNPHIEEDMEVQLDDQTDDAMEIQVQVQRVKAMKVLPLEEKTLLRSSIIHLANKLQQSKLEHKVVLVYELDIDKYICLLTSL